MQVAEKKITKDEAIKNGWLEEKTIILRPVERDNKAGMGVKSREHIAWFQIDNGTTGFCLFRDGKTGDLINPFTSDEERDYFQQTLGVENLNIHKPGNYFEKLYVNIIKDSDLMYNGVKFNMADPMENLRCRVIKSNKASVCTDWNKRFDGLYRWCLVDSQEEDKKQADDFGSNQEFWMYIGKYKEDTPKLRQILSIYFASIDSSKKIHSDISKELIMKEFNEIGSDNKKRVNFLKIVGDKLFSIKLMLLKLLEIGEVVKEGNNAYSFKGELRTYTFEELAREVDSFKEEDDDKWFILQDKIEKSKK